MDNRNQGSSCKEWGRAYLWKIFSDTVLTEKKIQYAAICGYNLNKNGDLANSFQRLILHAQNVSGQTPKNWGEEEGWVCTLEWGEAMCRGMGRPHFLLNTPPPPNMLLYKTNNDLLDPTLASVLQEYLWNCQKMVCMKLHWMIIAVHHEQLNKNSCTLLLIFNMFLKYGK